MMLLILLVTFLIILTMHIIIFIKYFQSDRNISCFLSDNSSLVFRTLILTFILLLLVILIIILGAIGFMMYD